MQMNCVNIDDFYQSEDKSEKEITVQQINPYGRVVCTNTKYAGRSKEAEQTERNDFVELEAKATEGAAKQVQEITCSKKTTTENRNCYHTICTFPKA